MLPSTVTADERRSRLTEGHLGSVDYLGCPPIQHFAAAGLVGGAQSEPVGKVLLTGKGLQIRAYLGDYGLRYLYVEAIHLGPIHSRDPV